MTSILVIRKDDRFSSTLREAEFDVVNLELIETKPLNDLSTLRAKLAKLSEYDGLFFTSPVAAEIFINERKDSNGFHGAVYVLGRRAQSVLNSSGLDLKSSVDANTAEEMLSEFGDDEFVGRRFLFVRGERSLRTIPESLSGRAVIDEVAVYRTEAKEVDPKALENVRSALERGEFDLVCFFSPSAVERFVQLFGDAAQNIMSAAIGKTTADVAEQAGFDINFISPRSNADDFARGLIEYIKNIE